MYVCNKGHFVKEIKFYLDENDNDNFDNLIAKQGYCDVCINKYDLRNFLYKDNTYIRAMFPLGFGVDEANRCLDLYCKGILNPDKEMEEKICENGVELSTFIPSILNEENDTHSGL